MQAILRILHGKGAGFLSLILFLLVSEFSYAEVQLGNMSYGRINTPNLTRTVTRGASFFRGVGGVAFEAVAKGEDGLVVSNLIYNPKSTDGKRLEVVLKNKQGKSLKVNGDIYDWQLVPIAKFANSKYGSAMTLFGDATKEQEANQIREAGGRIINYHSDFEDTLVGLRLFHADILIFQPNAVSLFKDSAGLYILGAGEKGHDMKANTLRFEQMKDMLSKEKSKGNTYSSYVVGDLGQDVTFSVHNNSLTFTGTPYWWMWDNSQKYKSDSEVLAAYMIAEEFSKKYESPDKIDGIEKLQYMYTMSILEKFEEKDGDWDALAKRLESYNSSDAPVESNNSFSRSVSKKVAELDGINPIVYANLKTVMHYSALFRHAKENNAQQYSAFLKSISTVTLSPKVETPTVQYGVVH